jgi:hypothetical protein
LPECSKYRPKGELAGASESNAYNIRGIRVIRGFEIRSVPALLSATLCAFTFYVAPPSRSILSLPDSCPFSPKDESARRRTWLDVCARAEQIRFAN